jgi:pseudouridine kinase
VPVVHCLGGAIVDRVLRPHGRLVARSSNPVTTSRSAGGVARNIAEQLARRGVPVALHGVVGDDSAGQFLRAQCEAIGIDCRSLLVVPDTSTAEYIAVLSETGELAVGLVDAAIFGRLDAGWARHALSDVAAGDWVVLETNVTVEAIEALLSESRQRGLLLAVDTVSVTKAARLPSDLTGITVLMCNEDEARAICALDTNPGSPVDAMAKALVGRGASTVIVTGPQGAVVATANGVDVVERTTLSEDLVVDVTGAGDAAFAATLASLRDGASPAVAARHGQDAAAQAIARLGS